MRSSTGRCQRAKFDPAFTRHDAASSDATEGLSTATLGGSYGPRVTPDHFYHKSDRMRLKQVSIKVNSRLQYHGCDITEIILTFRDASVDFNKVTVFGSDIALASGTRLPRQYCKGSVAFTSPGIAGAQRLDIADIEAIYEPRS